METPADAKFAQTLAAKAQPLEMSLLVTLLEMPGLLKKVGEFIEVEDFFSDPARLIFGWILGESKRDAEVSAALALSRFAGQTRVEPYLMELLGEMPAPGGLERKAEALRDLSIRRASITSMHQSIREMSQADVAVDQSLLKLGQQVSLATTRLNAANNTVLSFAEVGEFWRKKFEATVAGGGMPGVPSGFDDLDAITAGFQPADLIIIGGRPSMGKTTFAMNIVENIVFNVGKPVMVFSLEMPKESIYQRTLSSVGNIRHEGLRTGKLQLGEAERLQLAIQKLDESHLFIDDTAGLSVEQLSARAIRKSIECGGLSCIMVDYLQLMTFPAHLQDNLARGIAHITQGLKALGKELGIPVIALSQLSRALEQRPNKRPVNSDLRESGAIEQDADLIMFVYRDEVYNPETEAKGLAEIIIGKHRAGELGTVNLGFAGAMCRFENLGDNARPPTLSTVKQATQKRYEAAGGSFASRITGLGDPGKNPLPF